MLPGHPILSQVAEHFGQAILQEDGSLNRKALGNIIFTNPEERKVLESITHPAIRSIIRERMVDYEAQYPNKLVVADIPLLYESGSAYEDFFDEIMVVYVPRELQLERLMKRDGINEEQAENRLRAQQDIEWKKERADIVIDNRFGPEETEQQIEQFWRRKGLG
jgi:dephospho-CoA kinase